MLKRLLGIIPAVLLATSMAWPVKSPFVGEWKLDPSKTRMPDEMRVQSNGGGKYTFDFGSGTETIVLDGGDQPGDGGTLLSVKAEGRSTWIVERKKGARLLLKATWQLSRDGLTLTDDYREFESDGLTLSMTYVYRRAGQGSGFTGDWQSIKETINSPFVMQVKEFQDDGLSFVLPGERKTKSVTFDGKDYPNEGPGSLPGASSSIRRVDDGALVMTDKVDGKITDTQELRLSADLKTLTMTVHVTGREKPNVLVFNRQGES